MHPGLQVPRPAGAADRLRHVRLFQEPVRRRIHVSLPEGKGRASSTKALNRFCRGSKFRPSFQTPGAIQLHPQHGGVQPAALPAADQRQTQWKHHAGQPGPPHPHRCVDSSLFTSGLFLGISSCSIIEVHSDLVRMSQIINDSYLERS